MSCKTCGREAEGDRQGHWLGCEEAAQAAAGPDTCEHEGCSEPKKEWSGKGAKPKYCAAGHKKEN